MGQVLDVFVSSGKGEETHGVTSPVKLYLDRGFASRGCFILAFAVGLNIPVEFVEDGITESGKDYYQIHPEGSTPTMKLKSGEQILTSCAMILMTICDLYPACGLSYPNGTFERVYLFEQLLWLDDLQLLVEYLHEPAVESNPSMRAFFIAKLEERLLYFDKQILRNREKKFIQQHLTVADIYFYTIWKATYPLGLSRVNELCPLLQGYMKRLHLLPQIIGGEALLDQLSKEKTLVAGGAEKDSIEGAQSRKVSAKRRLSTTQPAELKF